MSTFSGRQLLWCQLFVACTGFTFFLLFGNDALFTFLTYSSLLHRSATFHVLITFQIGLFIFLFHLRGLILETLYPHMVPFDNNWVFHIYHIDNNWVFLPLQQFLGTFHPIYPPGRGYVQYFRGWQKATLQFRTSTSLEC